MTNKEAKDVLQEQIDRYGQEYDAEGIEALEIAINVLEQQPSEDCISREQAVRATYGFERYTGIDEAPYEYAESILKDLPSVTPSYNSIKSELKPCDDCISRQELLEELGEEPFNWNDSPEALQEVRDYQWFKSLVENAPLITPKTEPCEDCIRRADVLKYAQLVRDDEGIVHEMVHVDDIKDAPSVTWSGWTPATQLPEPNTAVLLHVKYKSSGQWTYQLGMWNDNKQAWEDWRTPYQLEEEFEVIAWMELPEGYEEDKHER